MIGPAIEKVDRVETSAVFVALPTVRRDIVDASVCLLIGKFVEAMKLVSYGSKVRAPEVL